jgi:hypothetical protein
MEQHIVPPSRKGGRRVVKNLAATVACSVLILLSTCVVIPSSSFVAAAAPSSGTLHAVPIATPKASWYALNDSNQLAGFEYAGTTVKPVRWEEGASSTFNTGGAGSGGGAFAIDNAGALFGGVVAATTNAGDPAIWSPSGVLTKLTSAAGLLDSLNVTVRSASDSGNVIGVTNSPTDHNAIEMFKALSPRYSVVFLGVGVNAQAINDTGQIAVASSTAPYLLDNGVKRPLKVSISSHFDLNNSGDVAGTPAPAPASGAAQAAIEFSNGTVETLAPLHPGDSVYVTALNDSDEAVGYDDSSAGIETAVAWIKGKPVPVASLVAGTFTASLEMAIDVNNDGSILAQTATGYYLLEAPGGPVLSVSKVGPGADPLSVDVDVKFKDSSSNGSPCDDDATYVFSDPDLDSSKKVASCEYELTFKDPGSGIYHVGLKATDTSGKTTSVTLDQYGNTVGGQFTLIIDSCKDPEQDVTGVDSLVNADDGTCDVMVGDWDTDATDLVNTVVTDTDDESSLAITPVPINSVDPSDWPDKAPAEATGSSSGWVPTGLSYIAGKESAHYTGVGKVIAAVQQVTPSGVPDVWAGAADGRTTDADAHPPAYVISAHGMWYTGNGLVQVPDGITITTYVPIGTSMGPSLGYDIDTGNVHGADRTYLHVYKSGQLIPNFTFTNYPDTTAQHVHSPTDPTTLSQYMPKHPLHMRIWISACAPIMIPIGKSFDSSLMDLPVVVRKGRVPISYVNVSISSGGVLQVSGQS